MKQIKRILLAFLTAFCSMIGNAQTIDLKGKITASSDLESIHVLNLTAQEYTITNDKGEFEIPAKLNDTILVSSVQYTPQNIVVTESIIELKYLGITLTDRVNELDEVVVGKILTGNLLLDIKNSEAKRDINFYDVGIPGYTGKPKTQQERRLYEADAGKSIVIAPMYIGINIHKILNKISGRTKALKRTVFLEKEANCIKKMESKFSKLLFENYKVEEPLKIAFFYYVAEDSNFTNLCQEDNDLKTYEWLLQKLYFYRDSDSSSKN